MATAICHCRNCQKQAGSAFFVVLVYKRSDVAVTGELSVYEDKGTSGQKVFRKFCGNCGSPIITDTERAQEQGLLFVKGGSLDDAPDLKPTMHYWTQSAHDWFEIPADSEIFDRE